MNNESWKWQFAVLSGTWTFVGWLAIMALVKYIFR